MSFTPTPTLPEHVDVRERKHRRRRSRRFHTIRQIRRRLKRINWKVMLVVVISVMATAIMGTLILTINAQNQVEDAWERLDRVLTDVSKKPGTELTLADFERLKVSVGDLNDSLSSAKRQTVILRPFTFVSADLDTLLKSLEAAQELGLAAQDILAGTEPTLRFLTEGEETEAVVMQLSSGERVVELLSLGRGRFLSAQDHLRAAQQIIDDLRLAEMSPDLLVTVDGLIKNYGDIQEINNLLLDSPELLTVALGLEETQSYLVLAQNSDEIRPSGGYISTYGWMTVRNGRIEDYDYSPSTTTSPNPPPEAMGDEIVVPTWWIPYQESLYAAWDGSWYADFPSTARMAAWYYNNGDNPQSPVDGVLSIDLVGFEYILEGLESVTVPDYNLVVTPETFREEVYEIRAEGQGDLEHKRFVAALYRQILSDWQSVDQEHSASVRRSVFRALQEKHIMVYFLGEAGDLNAALDLLGWSGAQKPATAHDYLMVADANLGSKSSRSVLRQLTYDVEIQPDGTLNSRTSISYDFSARVAANDPAIKPAHYSDINYHNIMQLFVPANSTLTDTNGLPFEPQTVALEAHTNFVALTQVDYNSSERFQFSYTTPPLVEAFGSYRRYKLLIQKQPGTLNELVSVQLRLPVGATVISATPEAAASYTLEQPVLEFRIELKSDTWIEVIYSQ